MGQRLPSALVLLASVVPTSSLVAVQPQLQALAIVVVGTG